MHSPDLINSHSQVHESGLEGPLVNLKGPRIRCRERCGSVVECLTRGRGFESHRSHCVAVLEQDTFILF